MSMIMQTPAKDLFLAVLHSFMLRPHSYLQMSSTYLHTRICFTVDGLAVRKYFASILSWPLLYDEGRIVGPQTKYQQYD